MKKVKFLADTNALIYIFKNNPCMQPYIAATAIANNFTLLTADKGFNKIKELNIILLQP